MRTLRRGPSKPQTRRGITGGATPFFPPQKKRAESPQGRAVLCRLWLALLARRAPRSIRFAAGAPPHGRSCRGAILAKLLAGWAAPGLCFFSSFAPCLLPFAFDFCPWAFLAERSRPIFRRLPPRVSGRGERTGFRPPIRLFFLRRFGPPAAPGGPNRPGPSSILPR